MFSLFLKRLRFAWTHWTCLEVKNLILFLPWNLSWVLWILQGILVNFIKADHLNHYADDSTAHECHSSSGWCSSTSGYRGTRCCFHLFHLHRSVSQCSLHRSLFLRNSIILLELNNDQTWILCSIRECRINNESNLFDSMSKRLLRIAFKLQIGTLSWSSWNRWTPSTFKS